MRPLEKQLQEHIWDPMSVFRQETHTVRSHQKREIGRSITWCTNGVSREHNQPPSVLTELLVLVNCLVHPVMPI